MVVAVPVLLQAFVVTIELFALSALGALAVGIATAAMRVSPVPPLRWAAAAYVQLVRSTPLTVVFFLVVFGLPQVGIRLPFFAFAILCLTMYTGTFVAEVVRSGIQSVPFGEIEAARSIGLSFPQILTSVLLPQALRSVVPPLGNVLVALLKNTSVASAFGVAEAIGTMTSLVNVHSGVVLAILIVTALVYIALALILGRAFAYLERKLVILR